MRIVVCIKHVPDTPAEREFFEGRLERGGDDLLNEIDENAVEAAVSAAEEHDGEVIAVTMGPDGAEESLLRALQMGADRAVLISDETLAGSDVVATALVLGAAIERIAEDGKVDMVILGMSALDSMTSLLAPALGARLGFPALTQVQSLEVTPTQVSVTRCLPGSRQSATCALPVLVSVGDQVNEPRYPNFAALAAAKNKPLETWDVPALGLSAQDSTRVGETGSGFIIRQLSPAGERAAEVVPYSEAAVAKLVSLLEANAPGGQA